jgi:archaellum component FlaF (FlaF/FlaG flagellin family)
MAGVCWQCTIIPVKVMDSQGYGYDSTIAKGVVYAVNAGAQVINMSLGDPQTSSVLADAIAYANYRGVLVVAAAGNESSSVRSYPAAYPDVLAVGATQRTTDVRAWFSNYNSASDRWVDVAAPGIVTGMLPSGTYSTDAEGTSFSSPIVAGIAGLVKTVHPSYTGWSLQHAISLSGVSIGSWVTYGRVDAAKALTIGTDTTPPTATGVTPGQWAKVHGVITVTPTGAADGSSGLRNVDLYVDGTWKTYDRTAPFALTYDTKGRNGPVHLQVRVYDKAGNVKVLDRWITADNTPPTVRITKAPTNNSKVKGTVKVYYTGSDKYGIKNYQFLVNGKVVQTHSTTKVAFSFVASKYSKNITVQVRAYDLAGNVKYTSKLYYHR